MRIYVASKFEEAGRASALMRDLERGGHTITYDWTQHTSSTPDSDLPLCATLDLKGVVRADVTVVLFHIALAGALVEMGAALGLSRRVIAVGVPSNARCIFFKLPQVEHVEKDGQVRVHLEPLAE